MIKYVWLLATFLILIGFAVGHGGVIFVSFCSAVTFSLFYFSVTPKKKPSRYVPEKIKNEVLNQQQGYCDFPGCNEVNYLEKHHKRPTSHGGDNSRHNIQYLCPNHHAMAHDSGFVRAVNYRKPIEVIYHEKC
jgi:hypothetical protein